MKQPTPADFSPKAFLKARRPEQFSDTKNTERTEVDRSLLEYHLATITTRSQEVPFQRFVKRLCERTVCPNLLPQTGPTGGGDSKVDSETYPVAEELSLTWYVGVGSDAHDERWAFAVSAKANWKPKLQDDVAKAVETGRGYKKVFFVTNQAISDKTRAKEEDALRAKHGVDVRLFDRNWILDRLFSDRLTDLAVEELGVTAISRDETRKGPADAKREIQLEEVEKRLNEAVASGQVGFHLAELAIEAAELARSIERPRMEVVGRLQRAEKLAERYGTDRQRVEAAYQTAWTFYWWFEDYGAFAEQYPKVQALARDSSNAYDLEQLSNLWQLLNTMSTRGHQLSAETNLQACTATLTASLERLSGDRHRPSTALYAETLLSQIRVFSALLAGRDPSPEFRQVRELVRRSRGLIGIPLEPLVRVVTDLGSVICNSEDFDRLFEAVVEASASAKGEIRGAQLLVTRGEQLLLNGRPAEAIAIIGRAFADLFKYESRHDAVHALYLCACAYADIGLLWAARGTLLTAASIATNDFWQYSEVTPYQAACYRRLKWIELQLGRIPHVVTWHQLDAAVRSQLAVRGIYQQKPDDDVAFELALGHLLIRTDFSDLREIERLPSVLDDMGLEIAADALLYALGHEDRLAIVAPKLGMQDARSLAIHWRNLEADASTAQRPEFGFRRTVMLVSRVLGCRITVTCENEDHCVEVAEAILATLEGFIATSTLKRAMAFEPEATIDVRTTEFAQEPLAVSVTTRNGRPHLDVRYRGGAPEGPNGVRALRDAIFDVAVRLLSRCVKFRDAKRDLEALFRDERVADRAIGFASGLGTQENILGRAPRPTATAWQHSEVAPFPLQRSEPWDTGESKPRLHATPNHESPPDLETAFNASHASISTVSPIRLQLWDRAGWNGVAFISGPGYGAPAMALIFTEADAPLEIFRHWKEEDSRSELRLRISVVRAIDKSNPHAYTIIIGADPDAVLPGTRFITMVNRMCRMEPKSSANLDLFLQEHEKYGSYTITAAYKPKGSPPDAPIQFSSNSIQMKRVTIIEAWKVGPNDIERMAISDDCDPVIPEGVADAPVLEVLRQNRERQRAAPSMTATPKRGKRNAKNRRMSRRK